MLCQQVLGNIQAHQTLRSHEIIEHSILIIGEIPQSQGPPTHINLLKDIPELLINGLVTDEIEPFGHQQGANCVTLQQDQGYVPAVRDCHAGERGDKAGGE